jgi:uncharacterized protein (DUF849 family)
VLDATAPLPLPLKKGRRIRIDQMFYSTHPTAHAPEEIADAAIDAWGAGASMVHLDVRDPETGFCVQNVNYFKEAIEMIRSSSDLIVNVMTGGPPGIPLSERVGIVHSFSTMYK